MTKVLTELSINNTEEHMPNYLQEEVRQNEAN